MRATLRLAALATAALCLNAQDFSDLLVEKIVSGLSYANGVAWSRDGFFTFSDVPASKMWKWTPGDKPVVLRENTKKSAGAAYDAKGDLYLCETEPGRIVRVPVKGGVLEEVAAQWQAKRFNSPNAITVRKDGQIYFTDPAFGSADAKKQLDFYGIYRIDPANKREPLSVIARPKGRPNGIALTADGRRLYVSIADERAVYAYDLDKDGAATNQRVAIAKIPGIPDGLAVDEKGNIYVAARGVRVYSPEGKELHVIEVGGEAASDVAFGGASGDALLITAAGNVYVGKLPVKGAFQWDAKN